MKKILLLACLLSGTASQLQAYGGRGADSPTATGFILLAVGAGVGMAWDRWYTDAKKLQQEKEEAEADLAKEKVAGESDKKEVSELRKKLQECEEARLRLSKAKIGSRFSSSTSRNEY